VRLVLAPVAFVDIGRQNHEARAAGGVRSFGQLDGFGGGKRGDGRNHWSFAVESGDDGLRMSIFSSKRRVALAQRAQADDAGAAVLDEPLRVAGDKGVIDVEVLSKAVVMAGMTPVQFIASPEGFFPWRGAETRSGRAGRARAEWRACCR
jgi:hypothetical protein